MTLKEQINLDLKEAMKQKNIIKRDALRLLNSAIKQIEVDEKRELSNEDIIKIIQKQVKQREDSITQYKAAQRDDLVQKEQQEIDVYKHYLPQQLNDKELKEKLQQIITQIHATSMKDIGKIMGLATKQLAGVADGKRINQMVKTLLS